jgi:hypothetical protein
VPGRSTVGALSTSTKGRMTRYTTESAQPQIKLRVVSYGCGREKVVLPLAFDISSGDHFSLAESFPESHLNVYSLRRGAIIYHRQRFPLGLPLRKWTGDSRGCGADKDVSGGSGALSSAW